METEYSNTKTDAGWNYTRLTERRSLSERISLAVHIIRTGVIELELFWKGDEVFIDSVSLRFGESRLTRFKEKPDAEA